MALVIALVVLAILLFGIGAVVEGLFWLVVIGALVVVAAVVLGSRSLRGGSRTSGRI